MISQRSAALACALLLSACSHGPTPKVSSSRPTYPAPPAPSSQAPATRAPVVVPGVYLAAANPDDETEGLYRVGADGVAHLVQRLHPPVGGPFEVHDVVLSAGAHPTTCVLWSAMHTRIVQCYPFGSAVGTLAAAADPARDNGPNEIGAMAVSADGRRFAWIDIPQGGAEGDDTTEVLRTGTLGPAGLTGAQHADVTRTACEEYVVGLAWRDANDLVLECNGSDDASGGYVLQHLPVTRPGPAVDEHHQAPYNEYRGSLSVQGSTVVSLENEYCEITCDDGKPSRSQRAVRWDLSTGEVSQVLVLPANGREMGNVWGGTDGLVYVTEGNGNDERRYVRLPGMKAGVRITGLHYDIDAAQP